MLTFAIDSRTAIPIRAIPYITGWRINPCEIASILANPESHCDGSIAPIYSYRISDPETIERVQPAAFNAIVMKLGTLAAPDAPPAVEMLPAGIFVFKDEFFPLYQAINRGITRGHSNEIAIIHDIWITAPLITTEEREVIFSGIPLTEQKPSRVNSRKHKIDLINSLIQKIENAANELDLPFDRRSIRGTKKDFAKLLNQIHETDLGIALSTLDDYFKDVGCEFSPGTRSGMLDDFSIQILDQIGVTSSD